MAKDHRVETFQQSLIETILADGEHPVNGIVFSQVDGRFLSEPLEASDIEMFEMAKDFRLVNAEPPYDHVSDLGNETRDVSVSPPSDPNAPSALSVLTNLAGNSRNPPAGTPSTDGQDGDDDDNNLPPSEQEIKTAALETIKTFGIEVLPGKSTAVKIALAAALEGKEAFTLETLGAIKTEGLTALAQSLTLATDGLDRNAIIAAILEKTPPANT